MYVVLKYIYSEKATKFCEISTLWNCPMYLSSKGQFYGGDFGNFVAFSEYINFT